MSAQQHDRPTQGTPEESGPAQCTCHPEGTPEGSGPAQCARHPEGTPEEPALSAAKGSRRAELRRTTRETDIALTLALDGQGHYEIATGVPFLDHMLSHVALHGLFDLQLTCVGDTEIDAHHTVEDVGIVLGQAFHRALGDRRGIARYGSQLMPMDEALALVALDFSGRSVLAYDVPMPHDKVGDFDTELAPEFLRALAQHAGLTLHVRLLSSAAPQPGNTHHIIEAVFKGLGRALGQAVALDARRVGIPSTKGVL